MPSHFPCPNPSCTHTFTLESVRGNPELVCPICHNVFRFHASSDGPSSATPRPRPRAQGPATPPPQKKPASPPPLPVPSTKAPPPLPPAQGVPSPLVAPAVPSSVPLAMPVGAPAVPLDLGEEPGALVASPRVRRARRKRGFFKWLLVLLFGGGVIGGLAFGIYLVISRGWLIGWWEGGDGLGPAAEQANFRFRLPGAPWARDRDLEQRTGANLALSRSGPRVEAALFFRDFQNRNASKAELVDDAVEQLRHTFDPVEYELKEEAGRLGGEPAVVMEFQGENPEKVIMRGECHAVARRGYAYWFFTWGPLRDREEVRPEAAGLRQRLGFLDGREGWTEQARKTEPLREGAESPIRYRIDYVKSVWEEVPREGYDVFADRVLLGNDPKRERYARDAATAQVVIIPGKRPFAEGVTAAREHFLEGQKLLYPETTMKPIKDKEGADFDHAQDVGNARGHLLELRVTNDETRERFAVLAIVPGKDATLVIVCESDWKRREYWDLEFMPLIDRFRLILK
jgi:hypothetical protein